MRKIRTSFAISNLILFFTAGTVFLSYPSLAEPASSIVPLSHRVVDAEYSKQLDRIVTVSTTPANQLHVVDRITGASVSVDLPYEPTCVSVGPDGLFAVVGHNGWISYVDLSAPALLKTLPVTTEVLDIVLAGNGWVYAFPRYDQWEGIRSVNLASGQEAISGEYSIYAGTLARLHPNGKAIYGADNGLSPSDIEKYDITQGPAVVLYDSPYHGDFEMCGNLWFSEDGLRIFTRCGNVFRSSETPAEDMLYTGSLEKKIGRIVNLSLSASANKVLAIFANVFNQPPTSDTEVWKYDYEFLTYDSKRKLPAFSLNGHDYPSHGKFVFFSADGNSYSIVVQADASSGLLLDYGILTVVPGSEQFVVHATAGPGGTITPFWEVPVLEGSSTTFTMIPDPGYDVANVTVDGVSVGKIMTYAFENITGNHTIEVSFTHWTALSLAPLNHRVVDAEYSKQLDRIVTVSTMPGNQLHVVDPLTGRSVSVDLPLAPTCVSVGPDGRFAAVGHNGWITYVNLSAPALVKTLPVSVDVFDIVLAGNGWVYAFFGGGWSGPIKCINLESGEETSSTASIDNGTVAKLHPSGTAIYGADDRSTFTHLEKYDITQGTAIYLYDSPHQGDYPVGGDLWISEDGSRIFTERGNVFRSSEVQAEDMLYDGFLEGIGWTVDVGHSSSAGKVLAIPQTTMMGMPGQIVVRDTEVWKYDDQTLSLESKIRLPTFYVGDQAHPSHGKFVFFSADGARYFVIVQADANSGILFDYGIFTLGTDTGQFIMRTISGPGGTITPFGEVPVAQGSNQIFTITPATGYHLMDVVVDDSSAGPVTAYEFTNVTANHTIAANFAINRYNLTVAITGGTPGTLMSYPAGITCGTDCVEAFDYGTVVTLNAMASTGTGPRPLSVIWSGDPDCFDGRVTINADKTCTATLYPWGYSPFEDVPFYHWAWPMIVALSNTGITGGCSADPPLFCPDEILTRAQMAVFIEISLGVSLDSLPSCKGAVFDDVNSAAVGETLCRFIEDFAARGITGGCTANPPLFCPDAPVTRQQMAIFLEAGLGRIPAQLPQVCSETFSDLSSGTLEEQFLCRIIEDFAVQGITGGCGDGIFCPNDPVTRAQMAVFLVAAPPPLDP